MLIMLGKAKKKFEVLLFCASAFNTKRKDAKAQRREKFRIQMTDITKFP